MSARLSTFATRAGALVLMSLLIAACGSATASSAAGGAGSTVAPGAGSAGPAGTAEVQGQQGRAGSIEDGLGHPVNICTLLPAATVASITGEPITKAVEDDTVSYKTYACNYTSADGTSGLVVTVQALDAAAGYAASLQATQAVVSPKPISGIGDKAFSGPLGVVALFGNVSITVTDLQSDDAAEALIRALQPKL
jgi:hypothetical protein